MPGVQPPEGNQKNYVEKPQQFYGEQYVIGAPLPIGAVLEILPDYPAANGPYVPIPPAVYRLVPTQWVLTDKRSKRLLAVLTDEQFVERFGGGPAEG